MKQYTVNINGKKVEVAIDEVTFGCATPVVTQVAPVVEIQPVQAPSPKSATEPKVDGEGKKIVSPMPGTVLKLKAANGSTVKNGSPLIVLEAMKMENEIVADIGGVVTFCVSEGDKLNTGDIIATIK